VVVAEVLLKHLAKQEVLDPEVAEKVVILVVPQQLAQLIVEVVEVVETQALQPEHKVDQESLLFVLLLLSQ
tara:strand:- start:74 stop:286 length:213 start_codon:yes stop_codon:yes gene_type:complete